MTTGDMDARRTMTVTETAHVIGTGIIIGIGIIAAPGTSGTTETGTENGNEIVTGVIGPTGTAVTRWTWTHGPLRPKNLITPMNEHARPGWKLMGGRTARKRARYEPG
ncbi:hypothetical protein FS749_008755 [Ceratobasidium sp. UAMH 11750]|nr:hypothetical protein FS749_008755 [Ceratobasidium sp. UAMH 11750]